MNFWHGVSCRAGCAVCFCSEADTETENGEGEEQRRERSRVCASYCLGMKECFLLLKLSIQKTTRLYLLFSFPSLLFGDKTSAQYHCDTTVWAFRGCAVRKPFRHFVALSGCCGLNFLAFFRLEKFSTVFLHVCV